MGHFLLARTPDLQPVCATLPGKSAIRFVVAAALHFASIALGFLNYSQKYNCPKDEVLRVEESSS